MMQMGYNQWKGKKRVNLTKFVRDSKLISCLRQDDFSINTEAGFILQKKES